MASFKFPRAAGNSHSLSLDVEAQWAHMEKTGQWRFTPPTHVVAAFLEALRQHEAEGGVAGRGVALLRLSFPPGSNRLRNAYCLRPTSAMPPCRIRRRWPKTELGTWRPG